MVVCLQIILLNVYLQVIHFTILIKNWLYLPNQQNTKEIFLHLDQKHIEEAFVFLMDSIFIV